METALEAFSMASFLEEFDSAVEKLYTDFTPSVVEKVNCVCVQISSQYWCVNVVVSRCPTELLYLVAPPSLGV